MRTPATTYSGVSIFLHWTIALLVIGQVALIMISDEVSGSDRGFWIGLHKSGGLTILVLTLVRLAWRLKEPWIPLPVDTPGWQKVAARVTHVGFYVLLLAMPLVGWAASSAAGRGIEWYGLFDWPLLPIGGGRDVARDLMDLHSLAAKAMYVLIALHILGALKHQFIDRDNEVRRMMPILPDRGHVDHRGPHGAP